DDQRHEVAAPALPASLVVVADRLLEERVEVVEHLGPQLGRLPVRFAVRLGRRRHAWIVPRLRIGFRPMRSAAALAAAVATVGVTAPIAYAAAPRGDAEQALRSGRYEQARRLACAPGRGRA